MIGRIASAFSAELSSRPCLSACVQPAFFVHDPVTAHPPACCVLLPARVRKCDLEVTNLQLLPVQFLALDKCIYAHGSPQTRCDCVLIINDVAHFVEFKTTSAASDRTTSVGYCLDQLAASIRDFHDRGIIADGDTVMAYACVGFSRTIPFNGARLKEQKEILLEKIKPRKLRLRLVADSLLAINK